MKRHALFVGVNAYDDKSIRRLQYSIPDASVLADRFKGLGYSTRLLADPTQARLKAAVLESVDGLGPGDVFLFFFAGHGFTSQDGAHLLFCRDDMQRLLRVNAAGIRVDTIEALTSGGGFNRAFLLDSCRTDSFANVECRGGGMTRDLDFVSLPKSTKTSGSFYLLRSCDKFRPSLEFDVIGHGLFTQGLLDAMDARDNRLAYCDTSFAAAVGGMMEGLQRVHHVADIQRPSIGEVSGPVFSLFADDFLLSAGVRQAASTFLSASSDGHRAEEMRRIEDEKLTAAIREKEQLAREEQQLGEEKSRQDARLQDGFRRLEDERRDRNVQRSDSSSSLDRKSDHIQVRRSSSAEEREKLIQFLRSHKENNIRGRSDISEEERARLAKAAMEREAKRQERKNTFCRILKKGGIVGLLIAVIFALAFYGMNVGLKFLMAE